MSPHRRRKLRQRPPVMREQLRAPRHMSANPTAPASEISRIWPLVSACAIASRSVTDGETVARREAWSITSTNSSGLKVHIFANSAASALTRLSMRAVAALVNVGTALDGSDGGSSIGAAAITTAVRRAG